MAAAAVTVTVARKVRPGREADFEEWADRLTEQASGFPGFLGAGRLRPDRGDEFHVVYRFDSADHLRNWEDSATRSHLLAEGDELMETVAVQRVTGLETWFSLPGRATTPPPKWKMFVVSGVVIYLLQVLEYGVFGWVTDGWPLMARLLLMSFPVTALMTWVVMPQASVLLRRWLYPGDTTDTVVTDPHVEPR